MLLLEQLHEWSSPHDKAVQPARKNYKHLTRVFV